MYDGTGLEERDRADQAEISAVGATARSPPFYVHFAVA